jgi:hypothetical protein
MTIPSLGTVERILRFIDRPWKIIAVVVLAVTAIVGWTLWEKRAELAEAVLQGWVTPHLRTDGFPKLAARLLEDTEADLVVLAEVTIRNNLLRNIDGLRRDTPGWRPEANPRPFYGTIRDPVRLVGLLEGRVVCHDLDPQNGEEERAEAALGIRRRCYIAVPPVLDALVGIIAIGWRERLPLEREAGATSLLYKAATQLASW